MKIYTNWAFLRPVNTSLHGDFTIENPSFSMYLLSTQEHTIPLCVKILQILFQLELSWFWIEGNGRFWDFLTFYVPLCSKKLSVHCVHLLTSKFWFVFTWGTFSAIFTVTAFAFPTSSSFGRCTFSSINVICIVFATPLGITPTLQKNKWIVYTGSFQKIREIIKKDF